MRGIISAGGYVPFRRLDRSQIGTTFGTGGGKGTRAVACYDEDTTTMGVEAARLALRSGAGGTALDALWFSTAEPGLPRQEQRVDDPRRAAPRHRRRRVRLRRRAALGRRRAARRARRQRHGARRRRPTCAAACPTSADESQGGDGAAAILVGSDADGPVHRRVPRRRERDRGVHRAVAHARLRPAPARGKSASAR